MAVDESMVPFKGRSSMEQYMTMYPVNSGYKIWCLAEARTEFVSQFDISSIGTGIEQHFGKVNWVDLKLEGDVSAAPFGDGCKKGI